MIPKRFSLTTALLLLLFFGALTGLYFKKSPWKMKSQTKENLRAITELPNSPDGTRHLTSIAEQDYGRGQAGLVVRDDSENILCRLTSHSLLYATFVTDDQILFYQLERDQNYVQATLFERVRPEWWWGWFYCPEF